MPPKGERPDEPINVRQMRLVQEAACQFAIAGVIEVGLCLRLSEVNIDYRDIIDGCMANPYYNPTIH